MKRTCPRREMTSISNCFALQVKDQVKIGKADVPQLFFVCKFYLLTYLSIYLFHCISLSPSSKVQPSIVPSSLILKLLFSKLQQFGIIWWCNFTLITSHTFPLVLLHITSFLLPFPLKKKILRFSFIPMLFFHSLVSSLSMFLLVTHFLTTLCRLCY